MLVERAYLRQFATASFNRRPQRCPSPGAHRLPAEIVQPVSQKPRRPIEVAAAPVQAGNAPLHQHGPCFSQRQTRLIQPALDLACRHQLAVLSPAEALNISSTSALLVFPASTR